MEDKPLIVSQSVELWLPLTANWLYNHLSNIHQVQSIVLARKPIEPDRFPWQPLYTPGSGGLFRFKVSKRLGRRWQPAVFDKAIQRHRPEILHSHFGDMGWYDLPLVARYGLKHVVTFYGYDVNMLPSQDSVWRTRYQELFSHADLFLCEGPHMASCLVDLGCSENKVKVQRLGVAVNEIAFLPRVLKEGEPLKVLIAGSFREKKGIPYALKAVGQLRNEGLDIQATVIGGSRGFKREELEREEIEDVLKQSDLHSATRMLGFQSHKIMMEEAYRHHVFLSPSVTASDGDTEGGAPVTIIEMAASGMPVVSTRHCDIPQVILDGRTGWLAKERDVEGLVTHLRWLLEHPQEWQTFTRQGRQHIEENFDLRTQAHELGQIYQNLANAH
jgi:colanic acid/amylovoran biosynthesis glycosyltransferase